MAPNFLTVAFMCWPQAWFTETAKNWAEFFEHFWSELYELEGTTVVFVLYRYRVLCPRSGNLSASSILQISTKRKWKQQLANNSSFSLLWPKVNFKTNIPGNNPYFHQHGRKSWFFNCIVVTAENSIIFLRNCLASNILPWIKTTKTHRLAWVLYYGCVWMGCKYNCTFPGALNIQIRHLIN